MTDAEKAYAAAERLIEQARDEGWTRLDLNKEEFRELDRLPESIRSLSKLRELILSDTEISDLTPLQSLPFLRRLFLDDTRVTNIAPLKKITNLTELFLGNTQVVDISPLSSLNNLLMLSLSSTHITNISPLKTLNKLAALYLTGSRISNINPVASLPNLEELSLGDTDIEDISPLQNHKKLAWLLLTNTNVKDIWPLASCSRLVELNLSQTPVRDITPLKSCTKLVDLLLDNTQVTDLRPTTTLRRLLDRPTHFGLAFKNCRAAQLDPEIAKIAEIADNAKRARTLFKYLKDWEPPQDTATPDPDDIPSQTQSGARYRVGEGGKVIYLNGTEGAEDDDLAELHDLLREDVEDLTSKCAGGHNSPFAPFHALLDRYQQALGATLADLKTLRFWNQGNKLRQELLSTQNRSDDDLDGPPPLSSDLEDGLAALVALHNSFCAAHSRLSELDRNRIDPINRPRAAEDRKLTGDLVSVLKGQDRVIATEVREDFKDLDNAAQGDSEIELRNLQVEKDSIENLVKVAVTEALKKERGNGKPALVGDLRAATVGQAMTEGVKYAAPLVAMTFPELVLILHPYLNAALSCWHGKDYPLLQTINWIAAQVRQRIRRE